MKQQSLSARSIVASASVLSMSVLWVMFVLPGSGSLRGGLMAIFTLTAALWVTSQLTRWMALAPPEGEPLPVALPRTSSSRK